MKKIIYAITLVLAIAMCLCLIFFPVMKFNREAIYRNHKDEIDLYISENLDSGKTEEELKESGINDIIYQVCLALQIYSDTHDVVYDEDGNPIGSSNDNEAIMFDLNRIKENGIKYTDLANGIKNQCSFDIELYKAIKAADVDKPLKTFFAYWCNPFPLIIIAIFIAFEFACAFLVIVRSIKGINEKKRNKLLRISIFGAAISICLLVMPAIFTTDLSGIEEFDFASYIKMFLMNIEGTIVVYYCGIGFLICIGLAIFSMFFRYQRKAK